MVVVRLVSSLIFAGAMSRVQEPLLSSGANAAGASSSRSGDTRKSTGVSSTCPVQNHIVTLPAFLEKFPLAATLVVGKLSLLKVPE